VPEQELRACEITVADGASYDAAAHDNALDFHWADDLDLEAALSPQLLQHLRVAAAFVSKADAVSHDNRVYAERRNEESANEILCGDQRKRSREALDDNCVDAKRTDVLDARSKIGDQARRSAGSEHRRGVRMKGEHDGIAACVTGDRDEAAEDFLMSAVDTVEIPQGDCRRSEATANLSQMTQEKHRLETACAQLGAPELLAEGLQLLAALLGFFAARMVAGQLLKDEAGVDLIAGIRKGIGEHQEGCRHLVGLGILEQHLVELNDCAIVVVLIVVAAADPVLGVVAEVGLGVLANEIAQPGDGLIALPLTDELHGFAVVAVDASTLQRALFFSQGDLFGSCRLLRNRCRRDRRWRSGLFDCRLVVRWWWWRRPSSEWGAALLQHRESCLEVVQALQRFARPAALASSTSGFPDFPPQDLDAPPQALDCHLLVGEEGAHLALIALHLQQVGARCAAGKACQAQNQPGGESEAHAEGQATH
jgi:hypothetical protein